MDNMPQYIGKGINHLPIISENTTIFVQVFQREAEQREYKYINMYLYKHVNL